MNRNNNKNERKDEQYPSYPHYPAKEDITAKNNNNGKVNVDEDSISLPDVNDIPGQENIKPAPGGHYG